ncbi:hypothetical protein HDU77_009594 [Chytriomyces hyalinus]|nr:hypothetical protein HDU77_009594 [Chytriomyces hyalinus]
MESTYKSKYMHSLEQRLACAEQQRNAETKALALRGEAAVLASRVALLRHACTAAGITLHPAPRMEIVALESHLVDSNLDSKTDSKVESNPVSTLEANTVVSNTAPKAQPPSLTPWHLIFRKLYPGQISHLRQHQRSLIDAIVLKDYLIPRLGSEAATTCLIYSSVGSNSFYGIPADLLPPFNDWLVNKMEQVSKMDEFSMSNKRRRSAPASQQTITHAPASMSMSPELPDEDSFSTASAKAKQPSASVDHASSIAQLEADSGLVFTAPPAPLLYGGLSNKSGYRTWVDVIRGRYPTFNRTSSHMCRIASQYLEKHNLKRVLLSSVTGENSHKPAFGMPARHHLEFLTYMESHFLKNGMFGNAKMHGSHAKANDPKSNTVDEDDENEEDEEDEGSENQDGGNTALRVPSRSGTWSASSSEKSENNFSEDEVMPVSNRARERRTSDYTSKDKVSTEAATSLLADRDWKSALNDDQRLYLAEHAKATKLLLRVRNQTHAFVKAKCESAGLQMVDTPTGFTVPEPLVKDLRKWFENAMIRHFQEPASAPEPQLASGEPAETARDKVSRKSEEMFVDAPAGTDPQVSSKKAKMQEDEIVPVQVPVVAPQESLEQNQQNIYYSASGLQLTKYNAILVKIMPDFKSLSRDARIAVKRGVKLFLQQEMGDQFHECMFTLEGAEHHTYGVPDDVLPGFTSWAVEELRRCFPDKVVLDQ